VSQTTSVERQAFMAPTYSGNQQLMTTAMILHEEDTHAAFAESIKHQGMNYTCKITISTYNSDFNNITKHEPKSMNSAYSEDMNSSLKYVIKHLIVCAIITPNLGIFVQHLKIQLNVPSRIDW
jgi:hypothetical protein